MRDLDIARTYIDYVNTVQELEAIDKTSDRILRRNKGVIIPEDRVEMHRQKSDWKDYKASRKYIKKLLKAFSGNTVEFIHNGKAAQAYLTKEGINHSGVGLNTAEKAAAISQFYALIVNAEYAYSSANHAHSNANSRLGDEPDWDVFVSVAKIGQETFPNIFKIRSTDRDVRSQIYRMATKNEIGSIHDGGLKKIKAQCRIMMVHQSLKLNYHSESLMSSRNSLSVRRMTAEEN
ncbi:MAG: hypothetical protein IKU68_00635 [Oscillospiraceae bacterium]|nr:hypothetical protein [Oscillospiraceae bacterium]